MDSARRDVMRLLGIGIGAATASRVGATFAQIGADRLIVVSNAGADGQPPSLTLVNPDTLEVLVTLSAAAVFSFPATRWSYARDIIWGGTQTRVSGISLSTGAEIAAVDTASNQNYTELTPDGRFVLSAARFQDRVYKIDARLDASPAGRVVEIAEQYKGAQPCDMTILADGRYAFTPDRMGEAISVFRVDPLALVATVPMERRGEQPLEPYMATVSPRGDVLLVENARGAGSESVFDVRDPERPREIARFDQAHGLGMNPLTSEISPDGRFGMVICRGSSEISVIDLNRPAIIGRVALPAGSNPVAGSFTPDGTRLFVPLPGRDALAVIAVPGFRVLSLVPVGARPMGAAYVESPMPRRQGLATPLGLALADGRAFPPNCPDPCCGKA